jgi:uncharacterized membrane protein YcaP (DUF421 family)
VLDSIDWGSIFGLTVPPLELVVRGTAMFWFLYLLFRIVLRRDVGSVAMADVLIMVIIADAAQNAMAGEYKSVTDGTILIATIAAWNVSVDWVAFRFDFMRRILEPPLLVVVKDGRINYQVLRGQFMSIEDLKSKLRDHGVDEISDVKLAAFESSGEFTVVPKR